MCDGPQETAVIIGAGPAGLTAAYELQRRTDQIVPAVFEAGDIVGGISRTETHNGYRFDIGGHRFFTKVPEVEAMWREVLGDDFITRPRLSRIYYRDKFYDYPLKIFNALGNIGPYEAGRIMLSYAKWKVRPSKTRGHLRGMGDQPLRRAALHALLPLLHGEGLGHQPAPYPRRLGRAADQEPVASQGGLERDDRAQTTRPA